MPSNPNVAVTSKTRRHKTAKWFCGGVFGAGLVPVIISSAIVTTVWFILFWYFDTTFTSLFPTSPWYWIFLFQLSVQAGIRSITFKIQRDQRRGELFAKFAGLANNRNLIEAYINYHRNKEKSIPNAIRNKPTLVEVFMESVLLEKQHSVLLSTLTLGSTWLFCFSVPFLFWGYYNWFGYFGCLLVQWPLLGLAHGSTKRVNYFASHDGLHKWFLTVDYDSLKSKFSN